MPSNFSSELGAIEKHLRNVLKNDACCPLPALERFWESLEYSLFSPGKRFRPLLSVLTAHALDRNQELVLPLASAVEMIHTYSLIHDDLPCLDNDDMRRGQPSNHKVFGEAMALLAGDGLLTMAFYTLARSPSQHTVEAIQLLADAAGIHGMVGGQVLDISAEEPTVELLHQIHARKTGALIQVSVEAAAVLCGASRQHQQLLRAYGEKLGLAFQLADDLQDFDPKKPEKVSFARTLGVEACRQLLADTSAQALSQLEALGTQADGLRQMVYTNSSRV